MDMLRGLPVYNSFAIVQNHPKQLTTFTFQSAAANIDIAAHLWKLAYGFRKSIQEGSHLTFGFPAKINDPALKFAAGIVVSLKARLTGQRLSSAAFAGRSFVMRAPCLRLVQGWESENRFNARPVIRISLTADETAASFGSGQNPYAHSAILLRPLSIPRFG